MKIIAYTLKAFADGRPVILTFETKKDAKKFKRFVNTYMEESGAGNGYGAYWVFLNETPVGVTTLDDQRAGINTSLLVRMRDAIVEARDSELKPNLHIEQSNFILRFDHDNFMRRKRPTKGDMFRSLFSYNKGRLEGRVIEDNGETLKVIGYWDEGKDKQPLPNAKLIEIKAADVMKIRDWMAKHQSN